MQIASRKPSEASPKRMGPLAKLPVFLDLAGKRCVVAGGSAMAAWKAELLAAAGGSVFVYAPELGPEMAQLVERGAAQGALVHVPEAWSEAILDDAAVAMCDAADADEAERFHNAARKAGAIVNVIDKPAYCQFQLGSIVNRSPVVVGISTDGAAPILAQAIRRRIETLLPPTLAAWGAIAKSLRSTVNSCLAAGAQRRAFWEALSERAFSREPDAASRTQALDLIAEIAAGRSSTSGRVTLVGAGPGDAEMLTLKAMRALQSADVILFDDLVSDDVLELARREAKRMLVGKRGRRESCAQEDINTLMIKLARQGKHVVRLKSGDPMIFGRAGEELAELEAAGVPVAVVPGISAGLALAADLGLSLTHRDYAHSVRLVTGHARNGELPEDLDWRGLADDCTTLLFYMSGRTAPAIAARLINEGMSSETPVVIATGVSRAEGRRWSCTLAEMAAGAPVNVQSLPVLIGVGRAFSAASAKSLTAADLSAAEAANVA